jgi:hypothetical protein
MIRLLACGAGAIVLSASLVHAADSVSVVDEVQVSKSQQAANRLFALDDKMQADYADTQRIVGEMQSPVILALFNGIGGQYILRRHGREVAVEPVPELYPEMKSVSHTIVGVYEIVSPYFDSPESGTWRPKLAEFNQMLKDGLATLGDVGMPSEVEQHCRTILEGDIKFTDDALKNGTFSAEGYAAYAKSVWPSIAANVQLAGKLQVDHFEDLVTKWRKEMGEEEWSRLYALVGSAWAMRRENVHFQLLAQMMGREAVNDRLIMAESIPDITKDQLLMLLGRIINDRALATLVFGEEFRMDVELMGEAARDETEKRATPHHPALGTDWMTYEEHKLPNEQ